LTRLSGSSGRDRVQEPRRGDCPAAHPELTRVGISPLVPEMGEAHRTSPQGRERTSILLKRGNRMRDALARQSKIHRRQCGWSSIVSQRQVLAKSKSLNVRSAVLLARALRACPVIVELEEWLAGGA
jgi:hypothetical protein